MGLVTGDGAVPDDLAGLIAAKAWRLGREVLGSSQLSHELGVSSEAKIVVIIRAGDRLHPSHGYDFLGPEWQSLHRDLVQQSLNDREAAVDAIYHQVLKDLSQAGIVAARNYARSASPYQVVHVCDTELETRQTIQDLLDSGLGNHELCDFTTERCGEMLIVGLSENLSYYLLDV